MSEDYKVFERALFEDAGGVYKPIDRDLFDKYGVKRGLRNSDGTGVMAGITSIGSVNGYYIDDGEKKPMEGHLRYRGYDLSDLIYNSVSEGRFGFEEVAYLLLFGELPTEQTLDRFSRYIGEKRNLPEGFMEDMILKAPSKNIMNKLARSVLASYSYDDNPDDISFQNLLKQSIHLISQMPVMTAYAYQAKSHYHDGNSLYIHSPQPELSTAENLLYMLRRDNAYTEEEAKLLDIMLMVHAEHGGGNNSAFTTRVVSSSDTDTYSAIAAAIGSLKGPKHGGANAKVMGMIENIKANVKNYEDRSEVKDYLAKILRGEVYDGMGLVYGMGHAIYTLSDPRAVIIKERCKEVLCHNEELIPEFRLYELIEELTPEIFADVKKIDKAICANVDLYSGFVYKMMKIPPELYTPFFAIARVSGWCAHRIEEVLLGKRIIRPAYKSICNSRNYIKIEDR